MQANELVVDWRAENLEEKSGRITRGAALALKSRVLLYAASPQFNPSGEKDVYKRQELEPRAQASLYFYGVNPKNNTGNSRWDLYHRPCGTGRACLLYTSRCV